MDASLRFQTFRNILLILKDSLVLPFWPSVSIQTNYEIAERQLTFLVWEVNLCYDVFLNALACR